MISAKEINQPYYHLKYIMEKQGIKQVDIANLLNIDISSANSKINRTRGRDFTLSESKKVADYLNINLNDFF